MTVLTEHSAAKIEPPRVLVVGASCIDLLACNIWSKLTMVPSLEAAIQALHADSYDAVLNAVSIGHEDGVALPSLLLKLANQGVLLQLPYLFWYSDLFPGLLESHARLARESGVPVHVISSWNADSPKEVLRVLARGDSLRRYKPANPARVPEGQDLLAALHTDHEMRIVVQPQIDLLTGQYIGAEALARWYHPVLGEIPPSVFVPMAHRFGLSMRLFHFVEARVVELLCRLKYLGATLPVSVNASVDCLCTPGFSERLKLRLQQAGVPSALFKIELTEDMPVSNMLALSTAISALRMRGFPVSMDDYGYGASTLDLLTRLPFSELKIDGRFVRGMESEPGCTAAVVGAISIARVMGLAFIAEGIETPEQMRRLIKLGCRAGQGFALSKPLEVEDLILAVAQRPQEILCGNILRSFSSV